MVHIKLQQISLFNSQFVTEDKYNTDIYPQLFFMFHSFLNNINFQYFDKCEQDI